MSCYRRCRTRGARRRQSWYRIVLRDTYSTRLTEEGVRISSTVRRVVREHQLLQDLPGSQRRKCRIRLFSPLSTSGVAVAETARPFSSRAKDVLHAACHGPVMGHDRELPSSTVLLASG
jgi:hypothetical protein